MPRNRPDPPKVAKNKPKGQLPDGNRSSVARAALAAGAVFATTIASILAAIGRSDLSDNIVLPALVVLCVVAALTVLLVAYLMRR
jgi:hypothetical protein